MVKKLAFFVEGQTEQIFVQRLITEVAGAHNVNFAVRNYSDHRIVNFKQIAPEGQEQKHFVLLYNCQGDDQVKSKILYERDKLTKAGYGLIIGLRDLYPKPLADLDKVKRGLSYAVPTTGVPTHIILAVAEVEAWFLQEKNHYSNISTALDPSTFKAEFNFDPSVDSAELIEHPAILLRDIYRSAGKSYRKKRRYSERTVAALDIDSLCMTTQVALPHFHELMKHIDGFLSP